MAGRRLRAGCTRRGSWIGFRNSTVLGLLTRTGCSQAAMRWSGSSRNGHDSGECGRVLATRTPVVALVR